ncbi:hypothetical protein P0D71_10415 [Paraburkholderia sp. RL17-383-BIF-A]|jgi:hypothetical protein|uniref:hypothetical protein n=1 Tax=Paraburkholderia TaxID=1822464 RepID=UPI0038B94928
MVSQDQDDKPGEVKAERRGTLAFANTTFDDVLIWVGTAAAILLMLAFVVGGWCLDRVI